MEAGKATDIELPFLWRSADLTFYQLRVLSTDRRTPQAEEFFCTNGDDMTITQIENTNQLPWGCTFRAVQAKDDVQALAELAQIAERHNFRISAVYKWASYYYGRVEG